MDGVQEVNELLFFFGTWNVGTCEPPDSLNDFLCVDKGKYDVYVISHQEIVPLKVSQLMKESKNPDRWNLAVLKTIGSAYKILYTRQLFGLTCSIFVKKCYVSHFTNLQDHAVSCGIFSPIPNKGAIVISVLLCARPFCFVASHLTSGRGKNNRRAEDYHRIVKECTFGQSSASPYPFNSPRMSFFEHDYIFWLGDLNYRIDNALTHTQIEEFLLAEKAFREKEKEISLSQESTVDDATNKLSKLITPSSLSPLSSLLLYDQFNLHRLSNTAFQPFQEMRITFSPSYRFDDEFHTFDTSHKLQVPAWCDRVVYYTSDPRTYDRRIKREKEERRQRSLTLALKRQEKNEKKMRKSVSGIPAVDATQPTAEMEEDWEVIEDEALSVTESPKDEPHSPNSILSSPDIVPSASPGTTLPSGAALLPGAALPPRRNTVHSLAPHPKTFVLPQKVKVPVPLNIPANNSVASPSPSIPRNQSTPKGLRTVTFGAPKYAPPKIASSTNIAIGQNKLAQTEHEDTHVISSSPPTEQIDSPALTTNSSPAQSPTNSELSQSTPHVSSPPIHPQTQQTKLRSIFAPINKSPSQSPSDNSSTSNERFLHSFYFYLQPLLYEKHQTLNISDHRPVTAIFSLSLLPFKVYSTITPSIDPFTQSFTTYTPHDSIKNPPLPYTLPPSNSNYNNCVEFPVRELVEMNKKNEKDDTDRKQQMKEMKKQKMLARIQEQEKVRELIKQHEEAEEKKIEDEFDILDEEERVMIKKLELEERKKKIVQGEKHEDVLLAERNAVEEEKMKKVMESLKLRLVLQKQKIETEPTAKQTDLEIEEQKMREQAKEEAERIMKEEEAAKEQDGVKMPSKRNSRAVKISYVPSIKEAERSHSLYPLLLHYIHPPSFTPRDEPFSSLLVSMITETMTKNQTHLPPHAISSLAAADPSKRTAPVNIGANITSMHILPVLPPDIRSARRQLFLSCPLPQWGLWRGSERDGLDLVCDGIRQRRIILKAKREMEK
ncbi:putative Inositol polyphosphate 5-phosphatase OCRL [Blattamonas nauphoetae]|uniref:Inositol polyphosphate 5-phosphatase OCRL n=1 Tax=Blattamonas nauphoetae TaxID=2049346 RepID=A0ABQ9X4J5_9EUKA|nr:putative Inositol polyphosphate 5-phosphatase OCRL [Blattamonas nauphoetae]